MRKGAALILTLVLLFSVALGESTTQKAPDYIMEGYDGDVTYRVWDNNLFFERMQEKTGISFQFRQYTEYESWVRRKEELIRGEDLPDVLFKAELSGSEVRDLYQAGKIIDLAPYLEQYAPDLWKLLEAHPDWKKAVSMPDGAIPALPAINTLQNNDVMWINTNWLKKLKLEMPTTAEELTEVLRAFKTGDPNSNYTQDEIPLTFLGMWELRFLGHAFGIIDNDYYVRLEGDTVTSFLKTDSNRAFLTWLHQLWTEGLLDKDAFINTETMRQITDEKKTIPYGVLLTANPLTVVPQAALSQFALLEPLTANGQKIYRDLAGDLVRGTFAVTSACSKPEALIAWVNNLYTEEGGRLINYGLEGEEYEWNEDGSWEWMSPLDTVANEILPQHTLSEGGVAPGYMDDVFQAKYKDENTRNIVTAMQTLKQYSVFPYPLVTLTAEQEKRVAEIQDQLSRYVEKTLACFVTGDIELTDENWNTFCKTVDEKGLQEMIGIWQDAVR